jgi:hypothetical protein
MLSLRILFNKMNKERETTILSETKINLQPHKKKLK